MSSIAFVATRWSFVIAIAAVSACTGSPSLDRAEAGADRAPRRAALVDASARQGLAQRARRRVIATLRDPLAAVRVPGELHGAPPSRGRANDARRAAIERRTDRVLADLEGPLRSGHATPVHRYRDVAMLALEVDLQGLRALEAHPEVSAVYADEQGQAELATSLPFMGATALHDDGATGAGTAVAVLDTPVRYWATTAAGEGLFGTCPARGSWAPETPGCDIAVWEDATSPPVDLDDLASRTAHGTDVSAIVSGVAPGARVLSINVFRWDASAGAEIYWMSDVIAGLDRVADLAAEHSIAAVNLSLGGNWPGPFPCDSLEVIPSSWPASVTGLFPTAYFDPIRTLWVDHGIPVVAATGNGGSSDRLKSPACTTAAISVAALFDTDLDALPCGTWVQSSPRPGEVACFSNINRSVDLAAPGVWVDAVGAGRAYGTSLAAPHVSGALALLQSAWAAATGAPLEPAWARHRLMLMSAPIEHAGVAQRALDVGRGEPPFDAAFTFPGFLRAEAGGAIPAAPGGHVETFEVLGPGVEIGSTLLSLEVVHPSPADVTATLTSPDGASVTVTLPGGGRDFNAIVGRDVLAGAFDALSGGPAEGVWSLSLADLGGDGRGFYVGAAVFVFGAACAADCDGPAGPRECGDDRCGGLCGACGDGALCSLDGRCETCTPRCGACGDDRCGGLCGACDDGHFCNGWEQCVLGSCGAGLTPCRLPDALDCTADCDEVSRRCDAPVAGSCVVAGACVAEAAPNPENPCEACLPALDDSAWSPTDGAACDDHDACTADDVCDDGACAGGPVTCDDGNPCTDDACDPVSGCASTPNAAACDDGDACTTGDTCAVGTCVGGAPTACDDGNPCTDDACAAPSGCTATPNDEPCDDRDACTVDDQCSAGSCAGPLRDCDDGDACSADTCDRVTGCAHGPIDCDDDDACTVDSCDRSTGCTYEAIECDDENPCTDDRCDPASGCVASANAAPCDDGDPCTADDRCAAGACAPGPDRCSDEPGDDGGPRDDGGPDDDGAPGDDGGPGPSSDGCACNGAGAGPGRAAGIAPLVFAALAALRRRRGASGRMSSPD